MRHIRRCRSAMLGALLLLWCSGCTLPTIDLDALMTGQAPADSAQEAARNFLTDLQSGDYQAAMAYMEQGNELLHVLPAAEGESIPEMDEVYRQFCAQLSEMRFSLSPVEENIPDSVTVSVEQRDYGGAIRAAMVQALRSQAEEGGDAFSDVAGWLGQGVELAQPAPRESYRMNMAGKNGGYYLQHQGYPDQILLNLITGGFYEYADLTMTTCVLDEGDNYRQTYYIAAAGDEVIGCLMELTEPYDTSLLTQEDIAQLQAQYISIGEGQAGIYTGLQVGEGFLTACTGIDFYEASQTALINAGLVSGKYNFNFGDNYLSLRATVNGFEEVGMTCTTMPQYEPTEE